MDWEFSALTANQYEEKYKQDFIDFNTAWIVDNFGFLEEEDIDTFEHIEESLENGAMIYFAVEGDTALATCMALPIEKGTWEICKLGSNKACPHKGAGSAVFKAAMDWAIEHDRKDCFFCPTVRSTRLFIFTKNSDFTKSSWITMNMFAATLPLNTLFRKNCASLIDL